MRWTRRQDQTPTAAASLAGMPLVTLLCGPAAAGKTTHARRLAAGGAVRLSMDEAVWQDGWRDQDVPQARLDELHRGLQHGLADQVAAGRDVVVDLSLASRSVRDEWRTLATEAGATVELIVLTAPLDVLWRRVHARDQSHANAVTLTYEQLRAYVDGFDWPASDEQATVISTDDSAD